MIKKFVQIKNLARFRDFGCSGDQTLRKLSLLSGENGRGKTTMAAIVRSLRTGETSYLYERQTLGITDPPLVEVLLDAGMARFDGTAWTLTYNDVEIFDQSFIVENIHVGESVEANNRRGLATVILGARGAEISRRIKEQDQLARDNASATRNTEQTIESHIPSLIGVRTMSLADFIALPNENNVDDLITAKQSELEAAQRATSIRLQQDILKLPIPEIPSDLRTVLSETLANVSAAAEKKVREHLKAEHMRDAKDWLSDGIEYMSGPTCPVCGRSVEGVDLIEAYKAYFSDEYAALKRRVTAAENAINDMLGLGYERAYREVVNSNSTTIAFWRELIPSLALPEAPDLQDTHADRSTALSQAMFLAIKKDDSLLEAMSAESLDPLAAKLVPVSRPIIAYNEAVHSANAQIADLKNKTASADISEIKKQLERLKLIKSRHSPDVVTLVRIRDESKVHRERAVAARAAAQEELSAYSRTIVGVCEVRINNILSDFGAGFRVQGVETTFPAGTAASTYNIVINGEAIEASRSSSSTPSFQTMLSGADKNALALAFFFAALDQDAGKANKVVFLDDPFGSQDEHRRNQTAKLIHKYTSECAQVIVSSHNPDFLRLVWDGSADKAIIKCLKLRREGTDDSMIEEWDIERETKHPFLRLHQELTEYMAGSLTLAPTDTIQKPRPLLEDYIRFRFPNVFQWNQWLGDMIAYFRTQGAGHPMFAHVTALTEINDYTKSAHHGNGAINETELRTHVQKTLDIVGRT